jgi:hypothetical protein
MEGGQPMVLTALILAAAVQAADPPQPPLTTGPGPHALPQGAAAPPGRTILRSPPPVAERTPNLYRVPEQCKSAPVKVQDRFGRPVAEKLGDLPKGALIYAVDRRVDGCPVIVVVYGTPALDDPNPPSPSGPERVTPAKHEDAPSNRR